MDVPSAATQMALRSWWHRAWPVETGRIAWSGWRESNSRSQLGKSIWPKSLTCSFV